MSLEAVEEILGALLDISRLDAGATRPEDFRRAGRRPHAHAGGRVRAARALEGARASLRPDEAGDPHRSPADAPAPAEPRLQRDQVHRCGARCWSAAGAGRTGSGSKSGTPASASRPTGSARCSRSSSGSTRARGSRRGLGLGLSIVERLGRVLDHPVGLQSAAGRRLGLLRHGAARRRRAPSAPRSPARRSRAPPTSR